MGLTHKEWDYALGRLDRFLHFSEGCVIGVFCRSSCRSFGVASS